MNKSFSKILEIHVLIYAFFFSSKPFSDPDFWFHLKTGEYIVRTGLVPRTEFFSFTNYGRPWIAHGWLSGVIFYLVSSSLGFYALTFLFALLTTLAFWIAIKRSHSLPLIKSVAMFLGLWCVLPNIGVRPRVFSILLASIFLALLTRYSRKGEGRAILLLVPLMAVWANLHGGFFIGLALIALTIVGIPLDALAAGESLKQYLPRVRMLGIVMAGSLVIVLLNPYGIQLYTFPIRVLTSPVFQNLVIDWLSPNFHQSESRPLLLLIILSVATFALSPKRVRPSELLLFLATLYATLKTQRNAAIFALVAAPLFADYLQNCFDATSFGKSFGKSTLQVGRTGFLIINLVLLVPLLIVGAKVKSTIYSAPKQELMKVPVKATDYLREKGITGTTFTDPNIWGGYVIWALPSNPVYIDGRDVYPPEFVKEFANMTTGKIDWRGPFDRYGVRVAMVEPQSVLARQLRESNQWEKVFEDNVAVVFVRR